MFGKKKKADSVNGQNTESVETTKATVTEDNLSEVPEIEEKEAASSAGKRKKKGFSYYFTGSILLHLITLLADKTYSAITSGLFGRFMGAYKNKQRRFDNSYFNKKILGSSRLKGYLRKMRGKLADGFENGFLLSFLRNIMRGLLEAPVRDYGNYFMSFGLYTVFAYFARQFIGGLPATSTDIFMMGIIAVFVAVPMIACKEGLATVLGQSTSARALLCSSFGLRDESFEIEVKQTRLKANLSIILGMASGILSLFISPLIVPLTILTVVGVSMIIVTPEVGVIVCIFAVPFFSLLPNPSLAIALLTGISAVSYLLKIIRGKRVLKFEVLDIMLLLFLILVFFSGLISVGGRASLYEAILCCVLMFSYYLVANMMRTETWVRRCLLALVSSATIVSIFGIVEYFFGELSSAWLDTTYFVDIKGRVTSFFDNANVLAFYLVMVFPFALVLFERCKRRKEKFLSLVSILSIILCVVFTWSRGAWIGILAELLIYLLIRTRKTVKLIFAAVLALPLMPMVLPENVMRRFMSIGDISDSSTYYRLLTWKSSLRAFSDNLFGGIGYGNSAFERVYPSYAYAGIEGTEHTHNLFLQIGLGMGIVGLLVFLVTVILFVQKGYLFVTGAERDENVNATAASVTAIIAALIMGMFDYIWYNNRILFLFFVIMGIACASVRIGERAESKKYTDIEYDKTSAYIDIEII